MPGPIVFISHYRVKAGKRTALHELTQAVTERLRADKPRTALFLSYLDEDGRMVSFLHAFEDAEAMDLHFVGSEERGRDALEFIEPAGWEFYGKPSAHALEQMRHAAEASGATLKVEPEYLAGFMRLAGA